jgi:hypothetical protein
MTSLAGRSSKQMFFLLRIPSAQGSRLRFKTKSPRLISLLSFSRALCARCDLLGTNHRRQLGFVFPFSSPKDLP